MLVIAAGFVFFLLGGAFGGAWLAFLGWFGPRGLNSLLFALLVVQAGLPQAEQLLAVVGAVVIVSVIAHGASATPLSAWYARRMARQTYPEEREAPEEHLSASVRQLEALTALAAAPAGDGRALEALVTKAAMARALSARAAARVSKARTS